jgi:hypothetical protein
MRDLLRCRRATQAFGGTLGCITVRLKYSAFSVDAADGGGALKRR